MLDYKSFSDSLNEKKGDTYESGCAMVYFDCPEIFKIQDDINPDDLYEEEGDRTYGVENEPHVTLLFGIHDNEVDENEVMKIAAQEMPNILLHNISAFENDKFDVLKFNAKCEKLHEINAELCKLPHTNSFPDYHPHATIAYLKSGSAKKYIDKMKDYQVEVKPSQIVYSKADGTKIKKDL
jgi:2'-5' RNA ligase